MPLISSSKRFAFFITCVHSLFLRGRAPSLKKNLLDSFTSFCSFSLFNFQGPARHLLGDSFLIISHTFLFVNNFFLLSTSFFQTSLCISLSLSEQLIYYTTDLGFVNPCFSYFKSFCGTVCITDSFYIIQLNCHFVNSFS